MDDNDWVQLEIDGKPLWRHKSGAQVYQSSFWVKAEEERKAGKSIAESSYLYFNEHNCAVEPPGEIPTWKAQRVDDVPDGDDDGYIYQTREEAMKAATGAKQ